MGKNTETFDLEKIDPKKLPELQGWKEKQLQAVKENPFIKIVDNETYQEAKKNRTALVTCRTTLQNQDKAIASKLKDLRSNVGSATQELIDITLPHETKQQEEVKRYEAEKEAEKERKAEEERQRVQKIKDAIDKAEFELNRISEKLIYAGVFRVDALFNEVVNEHIVHNDFMEFEELFNQAVNRSKSKLEEKKALVKKEEEQRKENERLVKEAEEEKKRSQLQAKRLEELLPYNKYGVDVDMATLWSLSEDAYKKVLSDKKTEFEKEQHAQEKREAEEADRQMRLQEQEEQLAQEKEQMRLAKEAENKMAQRSKILTDELGLKFNFSDAFVGENTEYVPVIDIKTKTDEEFDTIVENIKSFRQNGEQKNPFENQNSEEFEGIEDVEFEEPVSEFEKAIDESIQRNKEADENDLEVDFDKIEVGNSAHGYEGSKPIVVEKPKMLTDGEMNLTDLKDTCQGYIDFVWSDNFHEDNDYKAYIFETALQALFGKDVFESVNKKMV